jgi:DNA polymerase III subunit delta'
VTQNSSRIKGMDEAQGTKRNWQIVGHEWAVKMLQQHIQTGQMRHAYLFCGPEGIGRRTLAVRFAQALNCQAVAENQQPCGTCRICTQMERMEHPDMTVVQCLPDSQSIKVEQIRDLQRTLSLTPMEASYRIALLLNFHLATHNAQNALLKTLEEAPPRVILLMTADSVDNLLPTIASRCEILRLRTMETNSLAAYFLDTLPVSEEEAQLFASVSGGRVGLALSLMGEPERAQRRKKWLDDLLSLLTMDRVDRIQYAEKNFRYERELLISAGQVWFTFWRDVLVRLIEGERARIIHIDYLPAIDEVAAWMDVQSTREQLTGLQDHLAMLDANVNTQLLAEVMLLDLPKAN